MKAIGSGVNTVNVNLAQNDVLSLTVNPGSAATYTLTVKAAMQPLLAWRYTNKVWGDQWKKPTMPKRCAWQRATVSGSTMTYSSTSSTPAYFRGVVGDPCSSLELSAAVNERGWVFLNDKHLFDVHDPQTSLKDTMDVADGDVITIKAMSDAIGGIIANAKLNGKFFGTGTSAGWRLAIVDGPSVKATMTNKFDDCKWSTGSAAKPQVIKAANFPYATGAKYLWDSGAKSSDIVVARFVVGRQNRCGTPRKTTQALCSCEVIPPNDWSDCYYFTDTRQHYCKLRKCEPKYTCSSKQTGIVCIRRLVKVRVVPVAGVKGVCKKEAINSEMYVPYQQG